MVSIKDVANHSQVAISTVSKVLNGYPNVSEKTREKVNNAIKELGYVPNMAAAMLSSKQSGRIALLVDSEIQAQIFDEINMQYIQGATKKAKDYKLDIIILFYSMLSDLTVEELTSYLKAQNIIGLIVCGIGKESVIIKELIEREEFKFAVINAPFSNDSTSSIWIDNCKAQYDVAKETAKGNECKSIFYIAGSKSSYVTKERLKGIEQFAKDTQMSLTVEYGDFSEKKARELTLEKGKNADLIVCASDFMAIGAMKALIDIDVFHPICGFDGIRLMGYAGKQMNTVKQNFYEMANKAVEELVLLIGGKSGQIILADYELVRMKYEDIIS